MNKQEHQRRTHPLSAVILAVLLGTWGILAPLSWIGSAIGYPMRNLFSDEGLRWFYAHLHESFTTPVLAVALPAALLCGAVSRSGLGRVLADICQLRGKRPRITYRQKTALGIAGIFFTVYFSTVLLCVLTPHAILLGATGRIYPSPFAYGILPVTALGVQFTSMIYANLSNHLHGPDEILSVLYWGIRHYAVWIFITLLAAQLIHTIIYIFNLSV